MANDDNKSNVRFGALRRLANALQANNDQLYTSTYYTSPDAKKELDTLKDGIFSSINDLITASTDNTGEPNISKLYERILMNRSSGNEVDALREIFGDNEFVSSLSSAYLDNTWIRALADEIDDTLKYMPKLEEALQVLRDNVLSADSFSKDFLNIGDHVEGSAESLQFDSNIADLKKRYDLLNLVNEIYYTTSKYGETFIYCVPYQKAIQALLDRKSDNTAMAVKTNFKENSILIDTQIDGIRTEKLNETVGIQQEQLSKMGSDVNYTFELRSGVIESVVSEAKVATEQRQKVSEQSITEQYFHEVDISKETSPSGFTKTMAYDQPDAKLPTHNNFDHTLYDDMELPDMSDSTSADGLIGAKKSIKLNNINGCIVKVLRLDRVTPIILNDINLGYYYWEFDNNAAFVEDRYPSTGMINTITGLRSNGRSEAFDAQQRREELLKYLASQLSKHISTQFVNANQDLKKEIYHILKYNDKFSEGVTSAQNVKVTYIPPEDIHHFYFDLDKNTNRGISDLALALIPAKLWVALYVTNVLAVMTRGNDKRVYYVRQSVETNIAKNLLKTVNEIKKSNFGIRQIENINNVLNITGRFNDYIIPRGADGQSPIDFEVMPGQQIEIKSELLNLLEESAINATGVPIELIQARQSPDYAMQLTMSNTKFLRYVFSRQAIFQQMLNPLVTKLYNVEYGTNISIDVNLPPPLFINVTNTNQLITNTSEFCDSIVNIVMADETDDALKQAFAKRLKLHYLGSYLNMSIIDKIKRQAEQDRAKDKLEANEDEDANY